jgi:hypothetical protein
MISGKEANIRKVVGIVLYVSAALCFFLLGSDFASPAVWSSVTAAGIMIHRMGIQSQWGCIFKSKWNIDGKGHVPIPSLFSSFAIKKRNEVLMNMATSMGISIAAVSACYFLVGKGTSINVVFYVEIVKGLLYAMGAAGLLTYFAT